MTPAEAVAQVNAGGEDLVDALELLAQLTRRPAWHARARCRGYGPSGFFRAYDESAKATCRACPVRDECADAGMGEAEGVWGGLAPRERRRLRKAAG